MWTTLLSCVLLTAPPNSSTMTTWPLSPPLASGVSISLTLLLLFVAYALIGEALSSISQVAKISVISRRKDAEFAYKAQYLEGKLVATPKPCAGSIGTQIIVEDFFYNAPARLKAMRSSSEEQKAISELSNVFPLYS